MERLTPTIDTVPPLAAQDSASTMVASAPTASMTDSAPRPPVASSTCAGPRCGPGVDGLGPEALGPGQAFRHHVHRQDARPGPKSDAHCSAMMPTGPRPTTTTVAPGRMSARCAPR